MEDLFTHNVDAYHKEPRNLYKAAMDLRRQAEIVLDRDLAVGDYRGAKLVILPNSAALPENAVEKLLANLKNGGHVIATIATGTLDADGKRVSGVALHRDLGLWLEGTIKAREPFYLREDAGELVIEDPISADPPQYLLFKTGTTRDWIGESIDSDYPEIWEERELFRRKGVESLYLPVKDEIMKVRLDANWTVLASLAYRADASGNWEEVPAIARRSYGEGSLIYVAFPLGSFLLTHRTMSQDIGYAWGRALFARLLDMTIGPSKIQIEAPTCVKASFWRQGDKTLIHLVNEL